jgi:hypothetical protein
MLDHLENRGGKQFTVADAPTAMLLWALKCMCRRNGFFTYALEVDIIAEARKREPEGHLHRRAAHLLLQAPREMAVAERRKATMKYCAPLSKAIDEKASSIDRYWRQKDAAHSLAKGRKQKA